MVFLFLHNKPRFVQYESAATRFRNWSMENHQGLCLCRFISLKLKQIKQTRTFALIILFFIAIILITLRVAILHELKPSKRKLISYFLFMNHSQFISKIMDIFISSSRSWTSPFKFPLMFLKQT